MSTYMYDEKSEFKLMKPKKSGRHENITLLELQYGESPKVDSQDFH